MSAKNTMKFGQKIQMILPMICLLFLIISPVPLAANDTGKELALRSLGQNFIVGIPGPEIDDNSKMLLRHIDPAGIVLYGRNYVSSEQLKDLIVQLQLIAYEDTGYPYLIMLDEEPEGASRIGLLKNIYTNGSPDWKLIERDIAQLAEIGINVELAPVGDLPTDKNSYMKDRVPTKEAASLMSFNRSFIKALKKRGISATLKHFPGIGMLIKDPHRVVGRSSISIKSLDSSLTIFKDGIDNGADLVMTSHAIYSNIDPDNPATFSSKIVKDLLILKLGFSGIVITDDLSLMPLALEKDKRLVDAGIQAIRAGHNLLMFSHDLGRTRDIFDAMAVKMENDPGLRALVEANQKKMIRFKNSRPYPSH